MDEVHNLVPCDAGNAIRPVNGHLGRDVSAVPGEAADTGMSLAVDVHYFGDTAARAAAVAAPGRRFSRISWTYTTIVSSVAPYTPGEFYLRELPALRSVIPVDRELELIVIDGYVDLDPDGRPGLGAHVHGEYGVPVIGVAKSAFRTASHAARVLRGRSSRPLYVTAAGIPVAEAAHAVGEMSGPFRMPDALKLVDRLARGLEMPLRSGHAIPGADQ